MSRTLHTSRARLRGHLLPLGLFVSLTLATTFPLVRGAWSTIANYGDPLLNTWILAWDAHVLTVQPAHLFDANIFYPYPATLAYSEHLLGIAIPGAALQWSTGNPIFVHNGAILVSFVLAALGAYFLAYYLTRSRFAGLVAGVAFGFAGYRFTEISQIQNLALEWLPFTLLYLTRFFRTRARRDALLFVVFCTLQAWSNLYYSFYTAIAIGIYLVFQAGCVLARRQDTQRPCADAERPAGLATPAPADEASRQQALAFRALRGVSCFRDPGATDYSTRLDWTILRRLGMSLAAIAILMYCVLHPYSMVQTAVGVRSLNGQDGAALMNYLTVPARSLLGRAFPAIGVDPTPGKTYFPGLITIVLAGAGLIWTRHPRGKDRPEAASWRDRERYFYLALALIALVLSFGPVLRLRNGGNPILSPLPYAFLYRWVPGFSSMRVPARMSVLVIFALALLSGFGAAHLARHARPALSGAVLVLEVAGFLALPQAGLPIAVGAQVPEVYHWLASQPADQVVLELPAMSSYSVWDDLTAMYRVGRQEYFSTYHWHPTILGYSGFYPPLYQEEVNRLITFPSSDALSYLRGLNVRYVILHADQFGPDGWAAVAGRLPLFADQMSLVAQFGQDYVYGLAPGAPGQPAAAPHLGVYLPPAAAPGQEYTAYITADNPLSTTLVQPLAAPYTLAYQWQGAGASPAGEARGLLPLTFPPGESVIPVALGKLPGPFAAAELHASLAGDSQVSLATAQVKIGGQAEAVALPGGNGCDYHPADLNFGGQVALQGVTLDRTSYRAGDSIAFTFFWRRTGTGPIDDFVINFRMMDKGQKEVASTNLALGGVANWQPWQTVADHRLKQLPLDLPPGSYLIDLVLYDVTTQGFVPVITGDGQKWESFQTEIAVSR